MRRATKLLFSAVPVWQRGRAAGMARRCDSLNPRLRLWVGLLAWWGCVFSGPSSLLDQTGYAVAAQGVVQVGSAPDVSPRPFNAPASDYVIGAEDVLALVFWGEPQLSGDVLVRPDGKISVPLLDEMQAAGLTPKELRARLVGAAKRFVAHPVVTVAVRQINSRKVYVIGRVGRPGQYDLASSMTLLQLLAAAGGLQEYAKSHDIRLMRNDGGQTVSFQFDYDALANPQQTSVNFELKPGDVVIVP